MTRSWLGNYHRGAADFGSFVGQIHLSIARRMEVAGVRRQCGQFGALSLIQNVLILQRFPIDLTANRSPIEAILVTDSGRIASDQTFISKHIKVIYA